MTEIIKSHIAPPGIYKHVHSGFRIQVDFVPYKALPAKKNAYTEIGEIIVILVNILGWFVLATTLVVGMVGIIQFLTGEPTEEVKIEQAE